MPDSRPAHKASLPLGLLAAVLVAGALTALALRSPRPVAIASGTLIQPPRALPAFQLTDDRGQPFANRNLQGHWTLVFPGYTSCPDVCPTTLALLKQVVAELGSSAGSLQVLLLSVDPGRDTPTALHRYVTFFSPLFHAATTTEPELKTITRALGIAYQQQAGATPGSYSIDHSSSLILINPQGDLAGFFSLPFDVPTLTRDLHTIMESS